MDSKEKLKLTFISLFTFIIQFYLSKSKFSEALSKRIEISTPVSSFLRVQEGLFLYRRGLDPYSGGVYYQSPLILFLHFSCELLGGVDAIRILYSFLTVASGWLVYKISEKYQENKKHRDLYCGTSSLWISIIYLLNPLTFLPNIACSSDVILNFLTLAFIYFSIQGFQVGYACTVALSLFVNPGTISLVLPSYYILKQSNPKASITGTFFVFLFYMSCLIIGSAILLQTFTFLMTPLHVYMNAHDLTPNIGLWWYFFTEIFEEFRLFFLFVFAVAPVMFIIPITIRLQKLPLIATVLMMGIHSIFKIYPSIADYSLFLSLLPIFGKAQENMKYSLLANNGIVFALVLGTTFYHSWITLGCGNANFFYASNLILAIGISLKAMDFLRAVLMIEWRSKHPEKKNEPLVQIP
ncbi:pig-U [Schizosaccharomyces cryophilus OY26]|uniref:Pig-U n=1 Tax=Schizosaccharomyces cryophilus (strain OY26 / ATCC MYA-4695 / CBS 11777 / NBRC 106824 / NRRL Y48691) TaxID=653667 RepID=S9W2F0_SCHCR|nr:pig-U [Schizosaccharomyces cryophilus OY26]EPY52579.1 pig-U [Schizosaccharomyces cryophilus OY26]